MSEEAEGAPEQAPLFVVSDFIVSLFRLRVRFPYRSR